MQWQQNPQEKPQPLGCSSCWFEFYLKTRVKTGSWLNVVICTLYNYLLRWFCFWFNNILVNLFYCVVWVNEWKWIKGSQVLLFEKNGLINIEEPTDFMIEYAFENDTRIKSRKFKKSHIFLAFECYHIETKIVPVYIYTRSHWETKTFLTVTHTPSQHLPS